MELTAACLAPPLIPREPGPFAGSRGWGGSSGMGPPTGTAPLPDGEPVLAWSVRPSRPRSREGLRRRWRCRSSAASHAFFQQTLLFPVSCQIIAFGIQGSVASRRTKLKLELTEQNIVFPGNARAARGQAPTAPVAGRPGVIAV